jgi:hypothetical protein
MRHLLQPRVLHAAALAAAVSALACYPRLSLWLHRSAPVWYLEAVIFFCCITLWAFVLAWHQPCTRRPVFTFKLEPLPFVAATVAALGVAVMFHLWLDPPLRSKFPEEYPLDLPSWLASVAFSFALIQLFLVFAPCDWLMRLVKNRWLTMALTAAFAAGVQALKIRSLPAPVSPLLVTVLLLLRFLGGLLAVALYLRGGILLVWWWDLLLQCRHLPDLW